MTGTPDRDALAAPVSPGGAAPAVPGAAAPVSPGGAAPVAAGAVVTEAARPDLADLDLRPTVDVVRAVVRGHHEVLAAVEAAEPAIAALAEAAADRLAAGGRLIYAAAGAGGRIAAGDAVELEPTFGLPAPIVLLAGADLRPGSPEEAAAEDDAEAGAAAVAALKPSAEDVLIAVSASGRTPYALGALDRAAKAGVLTAAVVSTPGSPLALAAGHPIEVTVGAEAITGSTRLKAGTAQKLVLNAFSTALAVRRGRTLGNLMAGMQVANEKRRGRAARVCELAADCSLEEAETMLRAAGDRLDVAVVALRAGVDPAAAAERLKAAGGAIRAAIERPAAAPPSGRKNWS
jgi:N-acetylmuramic acid 6-phosphate etherase